MVIASLISLAYFRLAYFKIKKKYVYLPCSSRLLNLVNKYFRMGHFENVHHALNGLLQLCSVFSELLALFKKKKRAGLLCFSFLSKKKGVCSTCVSYGRFSVRIIDPTD